MEKHCMVMLIMKQLSFVYLIQDVPTRLSADLQIYAHSTCRKVVQSPAPSVALRLA
jgi:hypothetical protein